MAAENLVGPGFTILPNSSNMPCVASLEDGSSAARCGLIRIGDVIVSVNDINVAGMPLKSLNHLLQGDAGSRFTLGLKRHSSEKINYITLSRSSALFPPDKTKGPQIPGKDGNPNAAAVSNHDISNHNNNANNMNNNPNAMDADPVKPPPEVLDRVEMIKRRSPQKGEFLDERGRAMFQQQLQQPIAVGLGDSTEGFGEKVSLHGVGVQVTEDSRGISIKKVVAGGGADRSGQVKEGDMIVSVDGRDVRGMPMYDLSRLLVGPEGSSVAVGLRRPGVPQIITVTLFRSAFQATRMLPRRRGPRSPQGADSNENSLGLTLVNDGVSGGFKITKVVPGKNAAFLGLLQAGDVIVEVDNRSVLWLNAKEIPTLLHGPPGSLLKLGFVKASNPQVFHLLVRRGNMRTCAVAAHIGLAFEAGDNGDMLVAAKLATTNDISAVEVGDIIQAVNGQPVGNEERAGARLLELLLGPVGHNLMLTFAKGGYMQQYSIVVTITGGDGTEENYNNNNSNVNNNGMSKSAVTEMHDDVWKALASPQDHSPMTDDNNYGYPHGRKQRNAWGSSDYNSSSSNNNNKQMHNTPPSPPPHYPPPSQQQQQQQTPPPMPYYQPAAMVYTDAIIPPSPPIYPQQQQHQHQQPLSLSPAIDPMDPSARDASGEVGISFKMLKMMNEPYPRPFVSEIHDNGPAAHLKTEIASGDLLKEIDGKDVYQMSARLLKQLLAGPKGKPVELKFRSNRSQRDIIVQVVRR